MFAEANACGTPVPACPLGAAPEVVDDGRTGILCDVADWPTRWPTSPGSHLPTAGPGRRSATRPTRWSTATNRCSRSWPAASRGGEDRPTPGRTAPRREGGLPVGVLVEVHDDALFLGVGLGDLGVVARSGLLLLDEHGPGLLGKVGIGRLVVR